MANCVARKMGGAIKGNEPHSTFLYCFLGSREHNGTHVLRLGLHSLAWGRGEAEGADGADGAKKKKLHFRSPPEPRTPTSPRGCSRWANSPR